MTITGKSRKPAGNRSGKWLIALILLLVALAAVAAWQFRTRVPLLLAIATQVVPKGRFYGPEFAWISNDEYVCCAPDNRRQRLAFYRYRVSSGAATPLGRPLQPFLAARDLCVSPNGKWLFWTKITAISDSLFDDPRITRLDDGRTQELNARCPLQWEPDSRHLFCENLHGNVGDGHEFEVVDVLTHSVTRILPTAPNGSTDLYTAMLIAPRRLLEISPGDIPEPLSTENGPVEIREYSLDKSFHLTRKWSIAPPHDTSVGETKVSPAGDRMAWLVYSKHVEPGLAALRRLLPFLKTPNQPQQELWISRLDGTGMHVIGRTPTQSRNGNTMEISDLRWLPDGKHLSFEYDDALWTVSAQR